MKNKTIEYILSSYPRSRPPITEAHKKVFVDEYQLNRSGKGILFGAIELLESWQHRKISGLRNQKSILEIGAGSLNHVPYEPEAKYYDCIEPFSELYKESPYLKEIRNLYADIEDITDSLHYQRIISVAVLEHLLDLPNVVARSGLLLSPDGVFQASIPSEGGFIWGLSWRLSTGIAYRLRTGLDYKSIMRHEHVNSAHEIIEIIKYFFNTIKISRFPLPSSHLSFYTYIEASSPNLERCNLFHDENFN